MYKVPSSGVRLLTTLLELVYKIQHIMNALKNHKVKNGKSSFFRQSTSFKKSAIHLLFIWLKGSLRIYKKKTWLFSFVQQNLLSKPYTLYCLDIKVNNAVLLKFFQISITKRINTIEIPPSGLEKRVDGRNVTWGDRYFLSPS